MQFSILISDIQCQSQGNQIGEQVACSWRVDPDARKPFRSACRSGAPVQILDYKYSFVGLQGGQQKTFNFSVPVYFSDLGSGDYFFDLDGSPIRD
jgi:hypothetical protein